MVWNVVVEGLLSLIGGIFGLIPVDFAQLEVPVLEPVVRGFSWLNRFLPLAEAITIFGWLIALYGLGFVIRFLSWVWAQVPVVGGHSG